MDLSQAKIADTEVGTVDIVTALHACDTATDEAILFALKHRGQIVALVPCCQAEVARELDGAKGPLDAALASSHPAAGIRRPSHQCAARACFWKRMVTRCG